MKDTGLLVFSWLLIFLTFAAFVVNVRLVQAQTRGRYDSSGAAQQSLDTGDVTVKTVWRNGSDAIIMIIDKETDTRCYAAFGSINCLPAKESK